jgi:polar amino acid transport system ATP-binding protein
LTDYPKIRFDGVVKRYGAHTVLHDLNLSIAPGEVVSIIGPSGSGKTTVLRVLMTLEEIQEGVIFIDGEPLNKRLVDGKLVAASRAYIRKIRSRIGMVFQSFNLFPHMTALENCIEAPIYSLGLSREEAVARAENLLDKVGMLEKKAHYPRQLSGGQQQRVAIARALAMRPEILLFDEPTSALDPEMVGEVLQVIRDLAREQAYTMLLVTHQMGFAREVSDRICFFEGGKFVEEGPPDTFFKAPQSPRAAQFLSKVLDAG